MNIKKPIFYMYVQIIKLFALELFNNGCKERKINELCQNKCINIRS